MSKIYLVSSGSYSDYSIEGAFSSEEKAQEYINNMGYGDGRAIEDYDIDLGIRQLRKGLRPWTVMMDRSGKTHYSREGARPVAESWCVIDKWGPNDIMILRADVWALSEAHAIKIVNDKRAQMIANNEFKANGATT